MTVDKLLFAAVLVLCAVVALIALSPDPGAGHITHPEHSTMRHSGTGAGERGATLWVGWLFGVAIFAVFTALIAFGARHRIRELTAGLTLTLAVISGAWTWLVYAYRGYLEDPAFTAVDGPAPELFLALPAPTAIMIYLFWPLSGIFVLLFVLGFRHWVLSDEEFDTYQRLVDVNRRGKQGT